MKLFSVILLCFLTAVLSHDHHEQKHPSDLSQPRGCGYRAPDAAAIEDMAHRERRRNLESTSPRALFRCDACGGSRVQKIDTYIHTIQMNDRTGALDDSVIAENIRITNELLKSTGFQLNVVSTNRITSDLWYMAEAKSEAMMDMMDQYNQGGLNTLHIFYKMAIGDGERHCGYATLADSAVDWPDGIVVDTHCAVDKTTLAHEFGHWMNLLHTFDGGCYPGDLVDDTNAQSATLEYLTEHCPNPLPDTCPNDPGFDPLDNIMSTRPQGCGDIFTPGQVQRMQEAWRNIRNA